MTNRQPFRPGTPTLCVSVTVAMVSLTAAIGGVAVAAPAREATVQHCDFPIQPGFWDNVRVQGMSCYQGGRLHAQKLRRCTSPTRHVTRTAYVYTCRFGPWLSSEHVSRGHSFSDHVYIGQDHGRVWVQYDAVP
jgi:hypothetical protein